MEGAEEGWDHLGLEVVRVVIETTEGVDRGAGGQCGGGGEAWVEELPRQDNAWGLLFRTCRRQGRIG